MDKFPHDDTPIARNTASVERVRVSLNCMYATPRKAQHKMAEFKDISGVISQFPNFRGQIYLYIFLKFFEVNLDGFCE